MLPRSPFHRISERTHNVSDHRGDHPAYPKGIRSPSDHDKTLRLSTRAFKSVLQLPSTCVVQFIGVRALIRRAAARAPPGLARLAG